MFVTLLRICAVALCFCASSIMLQAQSIEWQRLHGIQGSYITAITLSGSNNNSFTFANAAGTDASAAVGITITAKQVVLRFDLSTNADVPNAGKLLLEEVIIRDTSTGCGVAGTQFNLLLFNYIVFCDIFIH